MVTAVTHVFTRTALGVTETVDNGTRSSYTRDTEGLLIGLKDKAGARYGATTDHKGRVLALVDTAGNLAAEYTYDAVTATGPAAASNPFRYRGRLPNPARSLPARLPRLRQRLRPIPFTRPHRPDPTGQEPNPYNDAQGDPIDNSDPTGAGTSPTWAAGAGAVRPWDPRWEAGCPQEARDDALSNMVFGSLVPTGARAVPVIGAMS